jgi:hypothetical protein
MKKYKLDALIEFAFAFEQATKGRRRPQFLPTLKM